MIEDIEGATSEPTRRRHVVVLSGAVAIASLVLLFSLVAPPELVTRQSASPVPSATAGSEMWIVTTPSAVTWKSLMECADGTQINPPYYLVFEGNGQVMTVPLDARAPSPLVTVERGWGWFTVPCATSRIRVPLMDRMR